MTFEARAEVSENGKRVIMPNEMRVCLTYILFFLRRRQHKNEENLHLIPPICALLIEKSVNSFFAITVSPAYSPSIGKEMMKVLKSNGMSEA